MMPAVPRVVRRIVVGIDASNASVEALRAAARVAAARGAELLGIYVEDDQLIRLASFARGSRGVHGVRIAERSRSSPIGRRCRGGSWSLGVSLPGSS